ncbi:choice-of-anchor A family protein [Hyalangium versicolor]|uniref:choice-of-anchor A family protein n=1 Tax=Hyalangium versicolor TaxID=2861190 RepID=UPI001CCA6577|nr:choice-of-anchor A family protein [Hyalangium versicolor]
MKLRYMGRALLLVVVITETACREEPGEVQPDAPEPLLHTNLPKLESSPAPQGEPEPAAGAVAVGGFTITYSVKDSAGHIATASSARTVTMVDSLPPTLTLTGATTVSLECGTTFTDPGAIATDQCFGDVSARVTRSGALNLNVPGTYPLTYGVTDPAGQSPASVRRTVNIRDTLAPSLTVNGPATWQAMCGTQFMDPGVTAMDQCDGNLNSRVVVTSNLNTGVTGSYTISYQVKDGAGHVVTASRKVTVMSVDIQLGDRTLYLLQNYSGGRDVKGKVAAGGNITLTDFSVGSGLPASDASQVLVAGGNLSLARGTVWGQAFYGGTYSGDSTVTFQRGTLSKGTPLNFSTRFTQLRSLSTSLAGMTPTATATRSTGYVVLGLTGTNPKVNVFEVQASAFVGINQLAFNAPAGSMVLVNIRGTSVTLSNFGITMGGGIDQHGILYNLPEATTLNASSIGIWGTILAPNASVTFNNGNWDGGIYAVSLTGTAEGHLNTLNNRAPCQ